MNRSTAFADWYAIDAYDPMTGAVTRLFVGSEDDCDSMYKGYYLVPQSTAHAKFYRYSIISTEDAHAFFSGIVTELDERIEYTITEAAEQLGVTRQRVHDLIMRGKLDAHKRGITVTHLLVLRLVQLLQLFLLLHIL